MDAHYFASPEEFGAWLQEHHASEPEVVVGYWKVATGRPSLTWAQAVREALRFGWIDGVGRRVDDERHVQRFSPRKKGSTWSKVNVRIVGELTEEGRMAPAGRAAFEARRADRTGTYAFERETPAELEPAEEARFRADAGAWAFWEARPPGYRRSALHHVVTAKRAETRERRLSRLIADSAAGDLLKHLRPVRGGS